LICAESCKFNCPNCCNEELKTLSPYIIEDYEIINEVLSNPFNKGIILAGLEWTLQPKEMIKLIELALNQKLEVILYTGMDYKNLINKFPQLLNFNIYIKTGRYDSKLSTDNNIQYGVKLASSNQTITKIKGEPNKCQQ
jgi:organic radical activating enzyme